VGEPASIRIQRRIEWSDTDASGAWHNSAAFNLIESAEVALVDALGFREDVYGRHPERTSRPTSWRRCGSATSPTARSAWPRSAARA
jgi:hypothetical protein